MNCPNCGASVAETENFCPECGARVEYQGMIICPNCGIPNATSSKCCSECGSFLRPQRAKSDNDKSKTTLILSIAIAAVIIIIAVLAVVLMNTINKGIISNNEPTEKPTAITRVTPDATHPPAPTDTPTKAPSKTSKPSADEITYSSYRNDEYDFSIPYPDGFTEISNISNFTKLSLKSNTDGGIIYICSAVRSGRSVKTIADGFIKGHNTVKKINDDCSTIICELHVSDGTNEHYCYHDMSGDNICGFEMTFAPEDRDLYMEYANYMKHNLNTY